MNESLDWDERARRFGDGFRGVLFKGFGDAANLVLHHWHSWLVQERLLPLLGDGASVLDLGCGYGRLGSVVTQSRADIRVVGQDMSYRYARTFADRVGPVVVGDLTHTPFMPESFDAIMAVTSLMYLAVAARRDAFATLFALLRPGGLMLAIDPGIAFQKITTRLSGRRMPEVGVGYSAEEYLRLITNVGFFPLARGGNVHFSRITAIPGVAVSSRAIWKNAMARAGRLDECDAGFESLTMHRWVLCQRPRSFL